MISDRNDAGWQGVWVVESTGLASRPAEKTPHVMFGVQAEPASERTQVHNPGTTQTAFPCVPRGCTLAFRILVAGWWIAAVGGAQLPHYFSELPRPCTLSGWV